MREIVKEGDAEEDRTFHVDLGHEILDSALRKPWQSGIYSKTLLKKKDLRIVLISMEPTATMQEHHADGTISIQVLRGAIQINVKGRKLDLPTGHLLTLDPSIKHNVEAVEDSAFLLTISWPSSKELLGMKHRGYGS
jgi:quercetin dioxygenase-like cupin family protein